MPFVFGVSNFDPRRFAFLNFLGAFLWALIFGLAGYIFGQIVEVVLIDIDKYELWLALAIVLIGAPVWLYRRHTINKKGSEE